ncbi:MAG: hypothetical protein PHX83_07395 [Acidobacteriia bacterium]|nr:hypothetical protein [Terriglobia bacterium]
MSTPNFGQPEYGFGGMHPSEGYSWPSLELRDLIGSSGASIQWRLAAIFLVALALSDLSWLLIQPLLERPIQMMPLPVWMMALVTDLIVAAAAVMSFRWIRIPVAAAAVTAVGISLLTLPLRWQSFHFQQLKWAIFYFASTIVFNFLFFTGLALGVRWMKRLLLGLLLGGLVGMLLHQVVFTVSLKALQDATTRFSFDIKSVVILLLNAVIFAVTFWGGLQLPWARFTPGQEPTAVPLYPLTGRAGELQQAADYFAVGKLLRPAGIGSVVFGIVAIALGSSMMSENPINAILAVIGVFLLIEGVWVMAAPAPAGMIVDGIALIVLGIWNIIVTISNASSGASGPHFFAILGLWQVVWGFQSFGRYSRFSGRVSGKPPQELINQVAAISKSLAAKGASQQPEVMEFTVGVKRAKRTWKGKLLDDLAVFSIEKEADFIVADKSSVNFSQQSGVSSAGGVSVSFNIGSRSGDATMTSNQFEKYQRWKPS